MEPAPDLTIFVGDKSFPVHRIVLILKSKFFRSLLTGSFRDSNDVTLDLENIDPDVFQDLIHLIYGRPFESSPALMLLATLYGVDVDIHELHEKFEVPSDQFVEYAEFMVSHLGANKDLRMIDRIVYNMPVGATIDILPQLIRENAKNSVWYIKWGTEYDTFNKFLLDQAVKIEAVNKSLAMFTSVQFAHDIVFKTSNIYRVWLFVEALGQQRDRDMHGNIEIYMLDIARNIEFNYADDIPKEAVAKVEQYMNTQGKLLSALTRKELDDISPVIFLSINYWVQKISVLPH